MQGHQSQSINFHPFITNILYNFSYYFDYPSISSCRKGQNLILFLGFDFKYRYELA